ncbi:hypothetical protein M8745_20470, partial [Lutimaribacter sp. EGI FJ00014]|nr:hypothetical protein [Lutimaribacter sp. EGI FJ00014]
CGAADAPAIERLMDEDTQVLVSVLDPKEESIVATASDLQEEGFGTPLLVTPTGYISPSAPPGRDVA